ncbi:unnamed protein product [Urochloa humidicola]
MLRRCVRDLRSLRSLARIPRPISGESPTFLRSRSNSTKASQTQNTVPGPQEEPSQSGSNVSRLVLGTLVVGAAAVVGAHQLGYIELKDKKLPFGFKNPDVAKVYEDLKVPSEQKVEQTQIMSEPNTEVVQGKDNEAHTPKDLSNEEVGAPGIQTDGDQLVPAEEKKSETLAHETHPVPDDHGSHTKLTSQDSPVVEINPVAVDVKETGEVPHEQQTDQTVSTVTPVQSIATTVSPDNGPSTDADAPKDLSGADVSEQKSLAETYFLQDEPDVSKDATAKETRRDEVVPEKTSDDGKVVLDIIDAIHAAQKKQADADAYMYSEEKRKLKEKYEKELKDTRARELMYAEEAAILDKELKKEKLKNAAAVRELQEKAEQKLQDELQRKEEDTRQQIEKDQELAKAELAAAVAKEKATQIEQIAEANLNIDALCMAFYARSEEARQNHSVHKFALGTLALEHALSSGSPIRSEVALLRKSVEGIDKDSLLELALSSLPEDVLDYGSDTRMELKQKETIRHFSLIPEGGGGILTHALARVASSIKIKEDNSGDGIESLINRVESLIVDGDLSTAADALEGGLGGSEAAEIATEWVKQARKCAIAEQTLALLHACASSTTFS